MGTLEAHKLDTTTNTNTCYLMGGSSSCATKQRFYLQSVICHQTKPDTYSVPGRLLLQGL